MLYQLSYWPLLSRGGPPPRSPPLACGAPTPRAARGFFEQPLFPEVRSPKSEAYLDSLCPVCFRQKRQYLLNSIRSVVFFLFFVVL